MDWPVPVKLTVPVPGVKVPPLLVQLPATLILTTVLAFSHVPEPMVKPFKVRVVIEPPIVKALVPDVVRLLKVWATAERFIA